MFQPSETRVQSLVYVGGLHPRSQWHHRLASQLDVPYLFAEPIPPGYSLHRRSREEAKYLVYAVTPRQGELHTLNEIQIQLMEDFARPRAPKRPIVLILLDEDEGETWRGRKPLENTPEQFKAWPKHHVFESIEDAAAFLNAQLAELVEEVA